MKIHYLSDALLASLRNDISGNLEKYQTEDDTWLRGYALERGLKPPLETSIEVDTFPSLVKDDGIVLSDLEATRLLYPWLKSLTPVQARDERMWVWLTHTRGYKYVRARWESVTEQERKDPKAIVVDRFFLTGRGIGALSRNALSRLWWFGYLTHDESLNDPFTHTAALLKYQNIPVGLFERNMGKNPQIVKSVVSYISSHIDEWTDVDTTVKKLITNLNCSGGAVVLDALDQSRIDSILGNCLPAQPVAEEVS